MIRSFWYILLIILNISTLFDDSVDLYQIAGIKKIANANFYYNLIQSISVRKMLVRI